MQTTHTRSGDEPATVPVLAVGAGPTGLVTGIGLARHGVRSILVECHPTTSIFPRATGVSTRTMEIFRWRTAAGRLAIDAPGLALSVRAVRRDADPSGTFASRTAARPSSGPTASSPGGRSVCRRIRRPPSRQHSKPRWVAARSHRSLKERRLRDASKTHRGGGRLGQSLSCARLRRFPRLSALFLDLRPVAVSSVRGVALSVERPMELGWDRSGDRSSRR